NSTPWRSAAQAFHTNHTHIFLQAHGHHLVLEAPVVGIHHVNRHLSRVPRVVLSQHFQMNTWIFVAGETDVADLPRLLSFESCLQSPLLDYPVGITIVDHLMKLPQIDAVCAEAPQAVLEIPFRTLVVALAVLRHEKNLVTPAAG